MKLIWMLFYVCLVFSAHVSSECLIAENIKGVNLRAQATSSSELIGRISVGEKYVIIGTNSTGSWLNIWYNDASYWAYGNGYFSQVQDSCIELFQDQVVTLDPDTSSEVIGTARAGSSWAIVSSSASWYEVWYDGKLGYIENKSNNSTPTVVSKANSSAYINMQYTYQPVISTNDNITWQMIQGPSGSVISAGIIKWTPSAGDSGLQSFTLRGILANSETVIEHSFEVTVKTSNQSACRVAEVIRSVNVRAENTSSSSILGFLNREEHYNIINTEGNWANIWYEGQNAWAYSNGYLIEGGGRCISINNETHINQSPSPTANNFGTISEGATIVVLQEVADWYQVSWQQELGYILKSDSQELETNETRNFITIPNNDSFIGSTYRYAPRLNNNQNVTYELTKAPLEMFIDQGVIYWQPTDNDQGSHEIILTASYSGAADITQTFSVTVKPTNLGNCAIFESIKGVNIRAEDTGSSEKVGYFNVGQQYSRVEQRGNWANFWFDGIPRWSYEPGYLNLTMSSCATVISQTSVIDLAGNELGTIPSGSQWVVLQQTDNQIETWYDGKIGLINKVQLQFTEPLEFISSPDNKAYVGFPFSYTPIVNQDSNITFQLSIHPQGMELDSGTINWLPGEEDIGNHLVKVIASSPGKEDVIQEFYLQVLNEEQDSCAILESVKGVNIRSSASGSSTKVGYFSIGDQYALIERQGNWASFWYDGQPRWSYTVGYLNEVQGECVSMKTETPVYNLNGSKIGYAPENAKFVVLSQTEDYIETLYAGEIAHINRADLVQGERRYTSKPNKVAYIGSNFLYSPSLNNNKDVSFQLVSAPLGMEMIDGRISWQPNEANIGLHTIEISASYPGKEDLKQSFILSVELQSNSLCEIYTAIKGVNIRTSNTSSSTKVGYFNIGEQYVSVEQNNNWASFWYDGIPRWAYAKGYLIQEPAICATVNNYASIYDLDGNDIGSVSSNSRIVVLQEMDDSVITWFDGKLGRLNKSDLALDIPDSNYEFLSTPTTQVMIGELFSYAISVNFTGNVEYSLVQAPNSMVINQNEVTWIPSDSDIGESTVIIRAIVDGQVILQTFVVEVSALFPLCNNLNNRNVSFIEKES
ncbi:hypothetical protein MKZ42_19010 [Pseudoalteromonas shioyasakiensis]|uniref:SH3b domain-containing protein n=1 Tax=Pseudoalteromonas shioyasakiensis TaxID=1190813 RepID=A0ABT6U6D7_9GAMM|nr:MULTISPECIES: hypothetical protein [Pseudoalteromonas]MDI4670658.1 hypothetical protein [Pseudoalteromonas shioyasakiensis]MDI4675341.1 hypothetical protein [Pseudoalteromonas shioyasakiensis]MDI4687623.1 hypothetical protein [Pseudoalteromonas shioyasakiensis]MDI4706162.1 hypothetical protein [Pseudoalteromonas shioyasakiensis]NUJ22566.1 hypothetical protein [Pseudoalteromonas sp. 0802]